MKSPCLFLLSGFTDRLLHTRIWHCLYTYCLSIDGGYANITLQRGIILTMLLPQRWYYMEHFGLVQKTTNETAIVILQRHLTCENCGKCGILSGSSSRDITIEALNTFQAQSGQRVVLETDDRQVLFISFMLYLVPVVVLLAGIFIGLAAAGRLGLTMNHELFAVCIGLVMMAAVFILIRLWDRSAKLNKKYLPVITDLVQHEETGCDQDGNY